MSQYDKAVAFRALHESPFVIPNPWDAGAAKILAALGFPALATTSGGAANVAGLPDGGAGRAVIVRNAAEIAAAVDLPVAGDLENGYDDVAETIRGAAAAGLVGGSIEDHTGVADDPIYPFDIAVARVAEAVAAVRALDFPFTLTARCENHLYGAGDLGDTIRRLQAFEAAGADVLYAPGLDLEGVRTLCTEVGKPVNVLAGTTPVADLVDAGATRISLGSTLHRAALGAFIRAAEEIRDHGTFGFTDEALPYAQANGYMKSRSRA